MSKLYTIESRHYFCPRCQLEHFELTDGGIFLLHSEGQAVAVRIGEVEAVA